jgi:site-specific DNA-methyltransferase (adenine-specific)
MTPYYQDDAVTIFHGDCREILPRLEPVDLVLTDPPYGVSHDKASATRRYKNRDKIVGDDVPSDLSCLPEVKKIIWGGNNFCDQLPRSTGWLVWHKWHPPESQHSQAELAWTNVVKTIRHYSEAYHGFMRAKDGWLHPTQKPIGLMKWCLSFAPEAMLLCDPFMGSGPVLVAAKDLGRKAIGIEIEEKYCEIAARRMSQEVLAL